MTLRIDTTVNGERMVVGVDPTATLLEVLRENLLLSGTKEACGVGECGTCVVLVDGIPVTSCLILAGDADGAKIETVEGLAQDGELSEVQQAFVRTGAFQCGFCTPGLLMSARALLAEKSNPDRSAIVKAISGNLCRCTGYHSIMEAVEAAAEKQAASKKD